MVGIGRGAGVGVAGVGTRWMRELVGSSRCCREGVLQEMACR